MREKAVDELLNVIPLWECFMKKTIAKLICVIMAVSMALTMFVGCDWITINTDRDMKQVVATVKISDEVDAEDIYKRQLVSGYVSYGYQYVYYYSYTTARAYEVVLENLVNNRIVIQQARVELAKTYNGLLDKSAGLTDFEAYYKANASANGQAIDPKSADNDNLKLYLTEYEIAQAYYNVRSNVNSMIEAYMDEEEEETTREDVTFTARTTPAAEEEEDLTEEQLKEDVPEKDAYAVAALTLVENYNDLAKDEKAAKLSALENQYTSTYALNMAVWKAYKIDISTAARRKAYGSMLQYLREQGLIESTEAFDYVADTDNVLNYTYFKDNLKSQFENLIVNKYEESLVSGVQNTLTDAAVWDQYKVDYENQKALYINDYSSYETALGNASDTSFVLYNPFEGYGYVANLLIGFTSEQSTALSDFSAEAGVTNEQIKHYRASLARRLYAKDQRETWVYLNYGEYNANGTFAFDEDYLLSDLDAVKNYIGTFNVADPEGYEEENDNGVAETKWDFSDVKATAIDYDTFVAEYLSLVGMRDVHFEDDNDNYGVIDSFDHDTLNKFRDLMFAFNTDAGGLSNEYGYVYSPITSATQYVPEFAEAAKLVVSKGVGAYTAVITDYGMHIIVCTKLVTEPYNIETDEAIFKADLEDKNTIAYKYKQVKLNAVTNDEVGKIANKFINTYRENGVTYYEKTYSDLVTETSAS